MNLCCFFEITARQVNSDVLVEEETGEVGLETVNRYIAGKR